jgi:hypothetical protein
MPSDIRDRLQPRIPGLSQSQPQATSLPPKKPRPNPKNQDKGKNKQQSLAKGDEIAAEGADGESEGSKVVPYRYDLSQPPKEGVMHKVLFSSSTVIIILILIHDAADV